LDYLEGRFDNEAQRRDLLIRPVLNSPFGLGYKDYEVLSEIPYILPVKFGQLFRYETLRKRIIPDYVLFPEEWQKAAGVVEAKAKCTLGELKDSRFQLAEQQAAFSVNWGILTDGIHWIIYHAYEPILEIDSIEELVKYIGNMQSLVGRNAVIQRMRRFGSACLTHLIVADPKTWVFASSPETPPSKAIGEVEVIHGPLTGLRGRLIEQKGSQCVIEVQLIDRIARIEISMADVSRDFKREETAATQWIYLDDAEHLRFFPYSYELFMDFVRSYPPLSMGLGRTQEEAVRDLEMRRRKSLGGSADS
jgi:hypothetical protein